MNTCIHAYDIMIVIFLEDGVDGDEVRLAVDLADHADLLVEVHVGRDGALRGEVAGLLFSF